MGNDRRGGQEAPILSARLANAVKPGKAETKTPPTWGGV
ncbi:hypothetical protein PAMC26577_12575 [Caballeronia sordidicola]|uniref:Uncharacterized protein n=1 Tax=Caballeronia sordidicola TaxID=196367 RepID=A0A242MWI7_CABSO|nr:hypothetical protein PAMC26577_12575 [Caballeronia sordidicola]